MGVRGSLCYGAPAKNMSNGMYSAPNFLKFNRPQVACAHDVLMALISLPLSLFLRIGTDIAFYDLTVIATAAVLFAAVAGGATNEPLGKHITDFTLRDYRGKEHSLHSTKASRSRSSSSDRIVPSPNSTRRAYRNCIPSLRIRVWASWRSTRIARTRSPRLVRSLASTSSAIPF